jgi:uncharacterized protein (TIGR03083 family)
MDVTQRSGTNPGASVELPLAPGEHLAALTAEAATYVQTLLGVDLDTPVPMSSDWTLRDLTRHVGVIHRWAAAIAASGREEPRPDAGVDDDALPAWFAEGADSLVQALTDADPQSPCWTFGPPETVAFWFRRQVNETLVHRVDAQDAVGTSGPIDPNQAADAVDELFFVTVPRAASRWDDEPRLTAPVLLTATDSGHSWLVTDDPLRRLPAARLVSDVPAEAAARLSGTASDLMLALWRRRSPDILEHDGDPEVARALFTARLTN